MSAPDSGLLPLLQSRIDTRREAASDLLPQVLRSLREHLGVQVAFLSQFTEGRRVFRYVDTARGTQAMEVGAGDPLEESYCQRIVDGRLPELIPDAEALDETRRLAVTRRLSIRSYLGVPVHLRDGAVYGTFCCYSTTTDPTLTPRDVELIRAFATIVAPLLEHELLVERQGERIRRRIRAVLDDAGLSMVYQPIKHMLTGRTVGLEALSRFAAGPAQGPEIWFREAATVGLGVALEQRAVELALAAMEELPPEVYLSCNVSPEVVLEGRLDELFGQVPPERVLLEITEHAMVENYAQLGEALRPLRERGMRLAVDDAGSGYASFRHILALQPEVIKLDLSLTRDIDSHPGRRALAAALIRFGQETGSRLVAEGVETAAEHEVLRTLGAENVQGYFVGRPQGLGDTLGALQRERGAG